MAKRILREITLDKIAAVTLPCQEHARAVILKRAATPADAVKAARAEMAKLDMPAARGFAEVLANNEAQRRSWAAESALWPLFDALRESLTSIAADPGLDDATKLSRAGESTSQFTEALRAGWPDVAEEIAEIAKASPNATEMAAFLSAGPAGDLTKENRMTDQEKIAGLEKQLGETLAKVAALEAEVAKAKAKPPVAPADEEMCGPDGKPTAKGRDFVLKHAPDVLADDEIVKVGDIEVRKSTVGPSSFAILKAQQAEIAKERDRADTAEFAKMAGDRMSKLVGAQPEQAALLKFMAGAPEAVRKTFDAIVDAAQKVAAFGFGERGTGGGGEPGTQSFAKSRSDFLAKVTEVQTRDQCSRIDAMSKAAAEFPVEFEAYREAGLAKSATALAESRGARAN